MCVWVSISNLEHSGRIADYVGELEDVGSELLLHVTEEKHCSIGGESTDACHCKQHKVKGKNIRATFLSLFSTLVNGEPKSFTQIDYSNIFRNIYTKN